MMLQVQDLRSVYGPIEALREVTLSVQQGEIVALVGGNGAGKTTLLRAISGVQKVSAGRICFDGADITRMAPARRVAAGIAQVPEGRLVFAAMAVEDNLRLGAYLLERRRVAAAFERVYALFPMLAARRRDQAGLFSGGQQQMLAIGRALMSEPRLLLLDEPSMGLAPIVVDSILEAIDALCANGTTILLVEQNARAALSIADRGYVIETGRILLEGTGDELLEDPRVQAAYLGV
jgi:branched-chain amino acid transport system ATP-binding protein